VRADTLRVRVATSGNHTRSDVQKFVVCLVRTDHKVGRVIVQAVAVYVVDFYSLRQQMPYSGFSNQDVLMLRAT
jgi:hypothetical protein